MASESRNEVYEYGRVQSVEPSGYEPILVFAEGTIVIASSFDCKSRSSDLQHFEIGRELTTEEIAGRILELLGDSNCFAIVDTDAFFVSHSAEAADWLIRCKYDGRMVAELTAIPNFYSEVP